MGSSASGASRAVLVSAEQLHFKEQHVGKGVANILKSWFEEGAPLGLTLELFTQTLCLGDHQDAKALFNVFDTDRNRKVDAFEVLAATVILAEGTLEEKIEAIWPIFDFSGAGLLNFDEANILLHGACRGPAKVCGLPQITDAKLVEACRQMFDAHNLPYDRQIRKEQVRRWLRSDVEATRFIEIFHQACSISSLEAVLAKLEHTQADVFARLCGDPQGTEVQLERLARSETFRRSLGSPSDEDFKGLLAAMASEGSSSMVSVDRFAETTRAWNAFCALDTAVAGELDGKDLPLLLRLKQHEEPAEGAAEGLRQALKLGPGGDGIFTRAAWIAAGRAN